MLGVGRVLKIYLFEREREHKMGKGQERERESEVDPLLSIGLDPMTPRS